MKSEKPPPKIEDIEVRPDGWERFVDAVKRVARHPPIEHPTTRGKDPKPKKRRLTRRP
jgi:hypothetical protein